jgi:hypothetical protein
MNPMEIARLIAMDLRVQETIRIFEEEQKRAEKEREKALAEKRDQQMVHIYKRRYQKTMKCFAANLWTHDIRSQSFPILRKNPLPDMPKRISSWMKPVMMISFERNDSHQVDSLPRWCVLVYITYVLLGLKKIGLFPDVLAIVRLSCSLISSLFEKSIKLLVVHFKVFLDELGDLLFVLPLIVIRLALILCAKLLATMSGAVRDVYSYTHRDDTILTWICEMDLYDFIDCGVVLLYIRFLLLTAVLDYYYAHDIAVGQAWFCMGMTVACYVWIELLISIGVLTDYKDRERKRKGKRKEKAKKPKISSSSFERYFVRVLTDVENATRLVVSRHLITARMEFRRLNYLTPFLPISSAALIAFLLPSQAKAFCYGAWFVIFLVLFNAFMLIREKICSIAERRIERYNLKHMSLHRN